MLESVGITELEERVYRAVLERPGYRVDELAEVTHLVVRQLRRSLRSLEAKGLVVRSATKDPRFTASSPDVALEGLIMQRQEQLHRIRLEAAAMTETFTSAKEETSQVQLVEVVIGRPAIAQRYVQLQRTARREMIGFDKPPYVTPPSEQRLVELKNLRRGVAYRAIYGQKGLESSGQLELIQELVEAGEEARTLASVPLKLVVADGRLGLIPLNMDDAPTRDEAALLLHASPLLDAIRMLFETLWERATPIRLLNRGRGSAAVKRPELDSKDERVLLLLAAGFMDQAIAHQLGVTVRTVERRVRRLMDLLEAQTRFQAGLQAAERGWLGESFAARRKSGSTTARDMT